MNDVAKSIALLSAGLVVCALALWGLSLGRARNAGAPVLAAWAPEDVESIEIERDGAVFAAARNRDGSWSVVSPVEAPADDAAVGRLLQTLASAKPGDSLTYREMRRMGRNLAGFGLSPARMSVALKSDRRQKRIFFGAPVASGGAVYAREQDVDSVFTVPAEVVAAVPPGPDALRDRALVRFDPAAATGFDVGAAGGAFMRAVRDGASWRLEQPVQAPASSAAAEEALRALASARARSFVDSSSGPGGAKPLRASRLAAFGLDGDQCMKVTVRCGDRSSSIVFGSRTPGDTNSVYALVQDGTAVVAADAALAARFARGADGFRDTRLFPGDSGLASATFSAGGKTWTLAAAPGGRWRLAAPIEAPADDAAANALAETLLRLREADRADPSSPDAVRVSAILSGKSAAAGPFFVKAQSLGGLRALDALRSRTVLALDESQIVRITAVCGGATNAVARNASRTGWIVEGAPSASARPPEGMDAFCRAIANVEASAVEDMAPTPDALRRCGFDTPYASFAIDMGADGPIRKNLLIGGRSGGGRFASTGAADAVFVLDAPTVSRLLQFFASPQP